MYSATFRRPRTVPSDARRLPIRAICYARRVSPMQASDWITARGFLHCLPSRLLAASRLAISAAVCAALLIAPTAAYARVTEIVVDDSQPLFIGTPPVEVPGYHQISGRAFGELDPNDPLNTIIQDIDLGKDPDGKVRYVASYVLTMPTDLSKAS